ncbi:MAG: hypothetical protein KDJ39_11780 [Gammaproteobacteria bacterium]|nr:hypothetical protein [Gammaproteobacteria bacterium]MCP5298407.1 hypothetical protein [Chromatiaceae bacterium]
MKTLFILFTAALLAGCQAMPTLRDTVGGGYVDLTGATLELHRALPIAAGRARVFVQDGAVTAGFDHYRTHCAFEIRGVDHDAVSIEPDAFRIAHVQQSLQQVVDASDPAAHQFAALAWLAGMDGDGSSSYYLGYHFTLYSARQPEVMRMTCYGAYQEPYDLEAPTLGEIRTALGDLATIVR